MKASLLGPEQDEANIGSELERLDAVYTEHSESEMIDLVANEIAESKAVGWMQGRMEFGPRALGARSMLADPRSPSMQKKLNLKLEEP